MAFIGVLIERWCARIEEMIEFLAELFILVTPVQLVIKLEQIKVGQSTGFLAVAKVVLQDTNRLIEFAQRNEEIGLLLNIK